MGYLKDYDKIARAVNYTPDLPTTEALDAFQAEAINLLFKAYQAIKTPTPITDKPDETQISLALFSALEMLCSNNSWVHCEHHEFTPEMVSGNKKPKTAKRYDIYFGNWSSPKRVEFGVEAKLLTENNFMGKRSSFLIEEYVGDAGMNKFINGTYKKRGCMLGYIVEGNTGKIIIKINKQIDIAFDSTQILIVANELSNANIYKSIHKNKLNYALHHLMLDFT